MVSKILCGYTWEEVGSVCLESRNAGKGDSCICIVKLPTLNVVLADETPHEGYHMCKCGEILEYDETPGERAHQRLRRIKSLLHMDPTRKRAVPSFMSAEFQTVMQTALMLDMAESLREIVKLLEEE